MLTILRNILAMCLLGTVVVASEPYCVRNESMITRKPVMKTRQVSTKPTGFFKVFKKTKISIETYQDFEESVKVIAVRNCCDGYSMSRFNICEPICTSGCPANAHCVEPNRCKCKSNYISAVSAKNGSHYCEPICNGGCPQNARCAEPDVCECERGYHTIDYRCAPRCSSGCPFGGVCILPDQCRCEEGYTAEKGTCVPVCTAGDGCLNGHCIDKDQCICNKGFEMNLETEICERFCADTTCGENFYDSTESDTATTMNIEMLDNEQTTDDSVELDGDEKIFLTPQSDYTTDTDYSDVTDSNKCPKNYIFYESECRPKVFSSNEVSCVIKPCVEHAICQENGTCACIEGYSWHKPDSSTERTTLEETSQICLPFEEITRLLEESKMQEIGQEYIVDWMSAWIIAVGVLCVIGALCFLIIKLHRHRNGAMHVEVKNDLYCTYDNKNSRDVPYVL